MQLDTKTFYFISVTNDAQGCYIIGKTSLLRPMTPEFYQPFSPSSGHLSTGVSNSKHPSPNVGTKCRHIFSPVPVYLVSSLNFRACRHLTAVSHILLPWKRLTAMHWGFHLWVTDGLASKGCVSVCYSNNYTCFSFICLHFYSWQPLVLAALLWFLGRMKTITPIQRFWGLHVIAYLMFLPWGLAPADSDNSEFSYPAALFPLLSFHIPELESA